MTLRLACSSIAFLVCATFATAQEPAPKSQRWAILIGVNDYAELEDLKYSGSDILALQKQFAAMGVREDHIPRGLPPARRALLAAVASSAPQLICGAPP